MCHAQQVLGSPSPAGRQTHMKGTPYISLHPLPGCPLAQLAAPPDQATEALGGGQRPSIFTADSKVWLRSRTTQGALAERGLMLCLCAWVLPVTASRLLSTWPRDAHLSGTSLDAITQGGILWLIPRSEYTVVPFAQQSPPPQSSRLHC